MRGQVFQLRLSEAEREALDERAAASGLTVSEFIRLKTLEGPIAQQSLSVPQPEPSPGDGRVGAPSSDGEGVGIATAPDLGSVSEMWKRVEARRAAEKK